MISRLRFTLVALLFVVFASPVAAEDQAPESASASAAGKKIDWTLKTPLALHWGASLLFGASGERVREWRGINGQIHTRSGGTTDTLSYGAAFGFYLGAPNTPTGAPQRRYMLPGVQITSTKVVEGDTVRRDRTYSFGLGLGFLTSPREQSWDLSIRNPKWKKAGPIARLRASITGTARKRQENRKRRAASKTKTSRVRAK